MNYAGLALYVAVSALAIAIAVYSDRVQRRNVLRAQVHMALDRAYCSGWLDPRMTAAEMAVDLTTNHTGFADHDPEQLVPHAATWLRKVGL